jgi:hypothetical protein
MYQMKRGAGRLIAAVIFISTLRAAPIAYNVNFSTLFLRGHPPNSRMTV